MLMKRKDVIKHSAIASKKSPITIRLFSNFICAISFRWIVRHCRKTNARELIIVLKLVKCSRRKENWAQLNESALEFSVVEDNVIHYRAENLENLFCAQFVSVQNQMERLEIFA